MIKSKNSFSIVIPILNEQETLEKQVITIINFIVKNDYNNIKIVLSDNGSDDNTEIIAKRLAEMYKDILIYHRVSERGVGKALKYSWPRLTSDIIGYMDLDLATDICHLHEVLELFTKKEIDFIYGTRLHKRSKVIGRSIKREIISRIFNIIIRNYFNVDISDGMCGFKFMRKDKLDKLLKNGAQSNGWFFCTEILIVAKRTELDVFELPVTWRDDPNSKVKIIKLTLEYIKDMYSLKRRFNG